MKRYFAIAIFFACFHPACTTKTEIEVRDVELISIENTESRHEPPPPPPPISNFITLQQWFVRLCDTETPDKSIIAYHFGLFETKDGYTIYLIGSKEYDKDNPDWAAGSDFQPSMKYYPLPEKEYKHLKWEQVLEKITLQLKKFSKTDKFKHSFFSKAQAVTTGFDDGDLVRIK